MLHIVLKVPVESVDQALISRQSLKSNRIDKVLCVFCHQHMYVCMKLFQGAGKEAILYAAMLPVTASTTVLPFSIILPLFLFS